ncbi:MAG: DMT family transporter [Desulfobacter sp.]|nr:MAG: DMT family transporter [Desulfobacter sp.]
MKPEKHITAAYTCLVIAMVLWASTFVALKLAFRAYDPMVVIFGRMLIASCCALFVPFVFKSVKHIRKQDIKYIALMAFCEPCLYFIFEAKALVYTSASQAGMITTMMPLITALGAWVFLKERISPRTCIGFAIAATGALWLSLASTPTDHGPNPLLGNFLEFMAMICATGYGLCLKKLTDRYKPIFLAFMQTFAGTLFYFPILFFPGTQLPTHIDPVSLGAVVYLGAVVTLGAYGMYNIGVSKIPASQAASFVNLIPVITLVMSALILKERFTGTQYMASLLVLAGVILAQDRSTIPEPVIKPAPLPEA